MSSETGGPKRPRAVGPLGPFEYYVMKIVARMIRQGEDTYASEIAKIAMNALPRINRPAQVYVILLRLGDKGYLTRTLMETPRKSGHTGELNLITPTGKKAMEEAAKFYRLLLEDPEDEPEKK
jgi:DNA-binding PadR family transcriptional regulator